MVHQDPTLPSARIRIIDMAPHLEALGFSVRLVRYGDWAALEAPTDAVVLQKKLPSFLDARRFKRVDAPIVFDFDDAVMFRMKPKRDSYDSPTRRRRFARTADFSRAFSVGNAYLASQLPSAAGPFEIIPSAVPHEVPRRTHEDVNVVRIVWVGLAQNLPYLASLDPVWVALRERDVRFRLVVVSNESFQTNACEVESIPWSINAQHDALAASDIGIMPLDIDSPWTRGKCAYKVLQYMAAELPVVASDVGMNRDVVGAERGFLASTADDWIAALESLAADRAARARLGAAGRTHVEATMTYPVLASRWASLLSRLSLD